MWALAIASAMLEPEWETVPWSEPPTVTGPSLPAADSFPESALTPPGLAESSAVVSNFQFLFVSTVAALNVSVNTGFSALMTEMATWLELRAKAWLFVMLNAIVLGLVREPTLAPAAVSVNRA